MPNGIIRMKDKVEIRKFGEHLTPSGIFEDFILPEIGDFMSRYGWVDYFAGEGNLILPILKPIPPKDRDHFFSDRILLFDIQDEMICKCIENAEKMGISEEVAKRNIRKRDGLEYISHNKINDNIPLYHITNPPYLYIGYIRKHMQLHLKYFRGKNNGYQDLYQIAMMNDLRGDMERMVYIIPSNFIFGNSVSNKIRLDFLKYYDITKAFVFEKKIFEHTGIGVGIFFFKRKQRPSLSSVKFPAVKIKKDGTRLQKTYVLKPKHNYRAGWEFDDFLQKYRTIKPLGAEFYLPRDEVLGNIGNQTVSVIDANDYRNQTYAKSELNVNSKLKEKIRSNILYVRTIDTGVEDGRIGLEVIRDDFGVDGIYVSSNPTRTQPIQLFLDPTPSKEDQWLLCSYFNMMLEQWRKKLDSDFLTNYKYSDGSYTRKYLGLTQVKALIETFPLLSFNANDGRRMKEAVSRWHFDEILSLLKKYSLPRDKKITAWFR